MKIDYPAPTTRGIMSQDTKTNMTTEVLGTTGGEDSLPIDLIPGVETATDSSSPTDPTPGAETAIGSNNPIGPTLVVGTATDRSSPTDPTLEAGTPTGSPGMADLPPVGERAGVRVSLHP